MHFIDISIFICPVYDSYIISTLIFSFKYSFLYFFAKLFKLIFPLPNKYV